MNRRQFLKWSGLGTLGAILGGGAWFTLRDFKNPYYSGPVTDHFNGKNFFNPNGVPPGKFTDLLKWQLGGGREKWPETYRSQFDDGRPDNRVEGENIQITMIGHASLLIQTAGLNFITDPVFSLRASPFQFVGPKRVNPPGVRFENLPKIDYVLLSHNHYDHFDLASLKKLVDEHGAKIITPLGNDTIIRKAHAKADFLVGDWGDVLELDKGVKLHFEPCHHWSARGMGDRRMALWAAFVVETADKKIYHVGDTGFHDCINYNALFEKHGPMDAAILPIGAYEPRWFMKGQHQNPDEAVQGHLAIKSKTTIGHHWGTFQLTNEAIEAPLEALEAAKAKYKIEDAAFIPLRPGEAWSA